MAVQIKELIVRARIQAEGDTTPTVGSSTNSDHLVEECVEQVLKILSRRKER